MQPVPASVSVTMPGRAVCDCAFNGVCVYADICDMHVLVAICDVHSVTNMSPQSSIYSMYSMLNLHAVCSTSPWGSMRTYHGVHHGVHGLSCQSRCCLQFDISLTDLAYNHEEGFMPIGSPSSTSAVSLLFLGPG